MPVVRNVGIPAVGTPAVSHALHIDPNAAPAAHFVGERTFAIGDKGWGLRKNGTWVLSQIVERRPALFTAPTVQALVNDGSLAIPPTPASRAASVRGPLGAAPSAPGSPSSALLSPVPLWGAGAGSLASTSAAAAAAAALTLGPTAAASLAAAAAAAAAGTGPGVGAGAGAGAATAGSTPAPSAPMSTDDADVAPDATAAAAVAQPGFDYYLHYTDANRRLDRWVSRWEFKLVLSASDVAGAAEAPPKMACYSPTHGPGTPGLGAAGAGFFAPGAGGGAGGSFSAGVGGAGGGPLSAGGLLRQQTLSGAASGAFGAGDDASASMSMTPRVATRRDRRAQILDDSAHPADPVVAALERAREDQTKVRTVDCVQIGRWELDAWYYSPYPAEYANLPKLYLCEWCLKYMRRPETLARHAATCAPRHPPGTEIYRKDNISVFEIDGAEQRLYAQCLCLFAKLYIDHKTLYFDVAPFLFYVLTENDADGCHIVGYFSKEKDSSEGYNLACILTFPQHQRKGYGKFLIAFSYALSRLEGKPGSPEKPLSDLGKVSYRSFWSQTLVNALASMPPDNWSLKALSDVTGIKSDDALVTLQDMSLMRFHRGSHVIVATPRQLEALSLQWNKSHDVAVDMNCLQWAPPAPDKDQGEAAVKRRRRGGVVSTQAAAAAAAPAAAAAGAAAVAGAGQRRSSTPRGNGDVQLPSPVPSNA